MESTEPQCWAPVLCFCSDLVKWDVSRDAEKLMWEQCLLSGPTSVGRRMKKALKSHFFIIFCNLHKIVLKYKTETTSLIFLPATISAWGEGVVDCLHLASFSFFFFFYLEIPTTIILLPVWFFARTAECSVTQLWGWRRNCSSSLIHKRIVLHSTWAVMLSLNYILPRQSSQPLLVSLLRHRAKCHLEIHHLRVPLTPQMHFQLSELCMAFKQSCISIFPFFFIAGST